MSDTRMNAEGLAAKLSREIFHIGDGTKPATRLQYMAGSWPDNETPQGGMCESALRSFLADWFRSNMPKGGSK